MSNTQIALVAASVAVALIVALWGITATYTNRFVEQFKLNASQSENNTARLLEQSERNTSRLIEQFEKRMNERDEKLLAKIGELDGKLSGQIEVVRFELKTEIAGLDTKIAALDAKLSGQIETARFELKTEIGELRGQLVGALRSDLEQLKGRVAQLERRAA